MACSPWRPSTADLPQVSSRQLSDEQYEDRLASELAFHKDYVDIGALPTIHAYWADRHIRPLLRAVGAESPEELAANGLLESARRCDNERPVFASIGAGNCDTEVRLAELLVARGLERFRIDCIDVNVDMLARGRALAAEAGLADHVVPLHADLNDWRPERAYQGVLANQSLHHLVQLERVFIALDDALDPSGSIVVNDMIGRNGHQRWPEALRSTPGVLGRAAGAISLQPAARPPRDRI